MPSALICVLWMFLCLQGLATILLLQASSDDEVERIVLLQTLASWLLLVPVFLPVFIKLYDLLFVNILLKCCFGKGKKGCTTVALQSVCEVALAAYASSHGSKQETRSFMCPRLALRLRARTHAAPARSPSAVLYGR